MRSRFRPGLVLAGLAFLGFGPGVAQEPAEGFAIWTTVPATTVQSLSASLGGAPQFAVGYRGRKTTIGVGLGLTRFRSTDEDTFGGQTNRDVTDATLFQLGPSLLVGIWESVDQRTVGNLALRASIGRLSSTDRNEFGGSTSETKTSGTLIGLQAGVGGEHFLDSHFALGFEGGLQATFATDIEEEGPSTNRIGLSAHGAYGALRLMLVF